MTVILFPPEGNQEAPGSNSARDRRPAPKSTLSLRYGEISIIMGIRYGTYFVDKGRIPSDNKPKEKEKPMAVPLDGIRAIHNAFRADMAAMDAAALEAARGREGFDFVARRHFFFNEILVWHAHGEEAFVFPALESVAPLVAEAYVRDHHGLDAAAESLHQAITEFDLLATARATSAFHFHLGIHLDKEDAHLYRIFNERVPLPNQAVIIGNMSQKVPQERFPEVIGWLYPLLGPDDRENMTRIWRQAFPAPVFAGVAKLIQGSIGNDWAELTRRIPELK